MSGILLPDGAAAAAVAGQHQIVSLLAQNMTSTAAAIFQALVVAQVAIDRDKLYLEELAEDAIQAAIVFQTDYVHRHEEDVVKAARELATVIQRRGP